MALQNHALGVTGRSFIVIMRLMERGKRLFNRLPYLKTNIYVYKWSSRKPCYYYCNKFIVTCEQTRSMGHPVIQTYLALVYKKKNTNSICLEIPHSLTNQPQKNNPLYLHLFCIKCGPSDLYRTLFAYLHIGQWSEQARNVSLG